MYKLLRENNLPEVRPAPRIVIFDLDEIHSWLNGVDNQKTYKQNPIHKRNMFYICLKCKNKEFNH